MLGHKRKKLKPTTAFKKPFKRKKHRTISSEPSPNMLLTLTRLLNHTSRLQLCLLQPTSDTEIKRKSEKIKSLSEEVRDMWAVEGERIVREKMLQPVIMKELKQLEDNEKTVITIGVSPVKKTVTTDSASVKIVNKVHPTHTVKPPATHKQSKSPPICSIVKPPNIISSVKPPLELSVKPPVICKRCLSVFKSKKRLSRHTCPVIDLAVADLFEEKEVTCVRCSKTFPNTYLLRVHLNKLHKENVFKGECHSCKATFLSPSELNAHLRSSLLCGLKCNWPLCNKIFKSIRGIRVHVQTDHLQKVGFPCPEPTCQRQFPSRRTRDIHFTHAHQDLTQHVCEKCFNSFRSEHALQKHKLYSKCAGRMFSCTHCDKVFVSKGGLSFHMWEVKNAAKQALLAQQVNKPVQS